MNASKMLAQHLDMHVLFSSVMLKAKELMESGQLVDDDTMIEGLFDFLMMLLLPKRDEHEWPDTLALKRYCQARRFSGRLENFGKILIGEGETADLVSPY